AISELPQSWHEPQMPLPRGAGYKNGTRHSRIRSALATGVAGRIYSHRKEGCRRSGHGGRSRGGELGHSLPSMAPALLSRGYERAHLDTFWIHESTGRRSSTLP